MNDRPVSFFAVEPPRIVHNLREKIEKRQQELVKELARGLASDWPDYKRRVGVLTGLQEALRMIDEMEKSERN